MDGGRESMHSLCGGILTCFHQLTAFIKYIVSEFNKRKGFSSYYNCLYLISLGWHEEQKPDCTTPMVRFLLTFKEMC